MMTLSLPFSCSSNIFGLTICTVLLGFGSLRADPAAIAPKPLIDLTASGAEKLLQPSTETSTQVTIAPSKAPAGVVVNLSAGEEAFPGIGIRPRPGASWDLTAFGHVEAHVTNVGAAPIYLVMRVDDAGGNDSAAIYLMPGQTDILKTTFGYNGSVPAYAINPAAITQVLLFTGKVTTPLSFQVDLVQAAGASHEPPPVDPSLVRVLPKNGLLLGRGVPLDPQAQMTTTAQVIVQNDGSASLDFPDSDGERSVLFKPVPDLSRWDLRETTEVRVRFKNTGKRAITPMVRLDSNSGPTDTITASGPIASGAEGVVVAPFQKTVTPLMDRPETQGKFSSDTASAVYVALRPGDGGSLSILQIEATPPAVRPLPPGLGEKPPVAGDWVKTFDDEFDGVTLDARKWNVAGNNFWDKQSHWSKDDVLVGGGVARLRYEKKTGFQNDDPAAKQSDWAGGYLDTLDKWVQRYGYFETRVKLPKAPGLWPGFWLMPDRGGNDPMWVRQSTSDGGMEFDVLEHLTRWGPYRYNVAAHWDGYGADHKSIGSQNNYVLPDKDGFITCGILWLPGSVTFYAQGKPLMRWDSQRVCSVRSLMMFTVPQGGWDNAPVDAAKLPDDLVIDYVRVWQRKDLASPADTGSLR